MDEDRKNRKWDQGKKDFSLIIPEFLDLVAGILTEGEKNHPKEPDGTPSWMMVEPEAYMKAALRHINLMQKGERLDNEMLSHHAGNVTCNMMFYWYLTFYEQWVCIPGYEGLYEVSNSGRVRRVAGSSTGEHTHKIDSHILKPSIKFGYFCYGLCKNGKVKIHKAHRLVLLSFIGPCPPDQEVMHLDGDRTNNKLENLRYGSKLCNDAFKDDHGTRPVGEEVVGSKLTQEEVSNIRRAHAMGGTSISALSRQFGVCRRAINNIINNKVWKSEAGNTPTAAEIMNKFVGGRDEKG